MVDEGRESGDDCCGGDVGPDVVGTKHHHNHVWLGDGEPAGELIVGYNSGGFETAMTFVFSIEGNCAPASRLGADEVGVGYAGCLELLPEEGTPTALELNGQLVFDNLWEKGSIQARL